MDKCISTWRKAPARGPSGSLWDRLAAIKPIFYESKSPEATQSAATANPRGDSLLSAYSDAIESSKTHKGALLFSVIGGTLSEGINFSDALGRCVIVVGLPFPNPHSAEWKARLSYITNKLGGSEGKVAAREFYENACMRSVNQSIGRAIRHKGDFAAILVIDKRYNGDRIKNKLPKWIGSSLTNGMNVSETVNALSEFFKKKI